MEGKTLMQEIEEALKKRAFGYTYEETEIIATKNGTPTKVKKTTKVVPPDVQALYLLTRMEEKRRQEEKESGK